MLTLLGLLAAAPPAQSAVQGPVAPAGPVETLHERVVEAIRNCRKPVGDEIVVCARDRGVAEAYRLPKLDPRFARGATVRKPGEALAGAGDSGTGSCSATGAGGATGCSAREYRAWRAARRAAQEGGQTP